MENINKVIGKNLSILRKRNKLTQMELAEKFNYSDKSISKWETGESLPSIEVLYELASFYNVTLDDLTHEDVEFTTPAKPKSDKPPKMFPTSLIVTLLSVCAVWLCATVLFVLLKILAHINYYMAFLWALPLSCIVLIVFNSIWGRFRYLFIILSVLVWSLLASIHIQLLLVGINIWPVYIVGAPLQIAIILWGAMVKKPRGYYKEKKAKEAQDTVSPDTNIENENTEKKED
ncbi:MAG: helix-turn-helix transcriptional regulator [Clostridiales bacterium]|nr:helix-turn-helix transcriptional regulator [Clostridiales bacterium]